MHGAPACRTCPFAHGGLAHLPAVLLASHLVVAGINWARLLLLFLPHDLRTEFQESKAQTEHPPKARTTPLHPCQAGGRDKDHPPSGQKTCQATQLGPRGKPQGGCVCFPGNTKNFLAQLFSYCQCVHLLWDRAVARARGQATHLPASAITIPHSGTHTARQFPSHLPDLGPLQR